MDTINMFCSPLGDNRPLWSRLEAGGETRYLILCGMSGRNLPFLGFTFITPRPRRPGPKALAQLSRCCLTGITSALIHHCYQLHVCAGTVGK